MNHDFDDIIGDDPELATELSGVLDMLAAARPLPSPAFRGQLARQLATQPSYGTLRRLRVRALGMAASGCVMLGVAGIGVAGAGPLASTGVAAAQAASVGVHSDQMVAMYSAVNPDL
jgi:hypothetical protein